MDRRENITHCSDDKGFHVIFILYWRNEFRFVAVCMAAEREKKKEKEIRVLHNRIFEYSIDDEEWFVTTVPNIFHIPLIFIISLVCITSSFEWKRNVSIFFDKLTSFENIKEMSKKYEFRANHFCGVL